MTTKSPTYRVEFVGDALRHPKLSVTSSFFCGLLEPVLSWCGCGAADRRAPSKQIQSRVFRSLWTW
jgi:hypothetical protein